MQPLYLTGGDAVVLAFLHRPEPRTETGVGVLFCPPFGWDDICSYRARRDWAERLAARGHAALRFDLPGTGDSAGSPHDPHLVDAWVAAVAESASRLRVETGAARVVALGIGLGGILARVAASRGASIDDFVLWGVPAGGHQLVRELRAFARIETSAIVAAGSPQPPPSLEGLLAPGGFLVTSETAEALAEIDLATMPLPDSSRVLELKRDAAFAAMMVRPDESKPPLRTFARVDEWLEENVGLQPSGHCGVAPAVDAEVGGGVRESPLVVTSGGQALVGVLAEPTDSAPSGVALVLLNAAAVRRSGPNRFWTDIARRWASLGLPALRIDLAGIGDSEGDGSRYGEVAPLYEAGFVRQVEAVLDELERRGVAERFVVLGLCSGGYWAFHAALEDARVTSAVLLNSRVLFWDEALEPERDARRIRRRALSPTAWARVLRGEIRLGPSRLASAAAAFIRRAAERHDVEAAFDRLREAGKRVTFVFCDGEPLRDELEESGLLRDADRWPNITVELVPGRDHTFRPYWMHEYVHAAVDRALAAEIAFRSQPPP